MVKLERILCPVDFSGCSRHALQQAQVIARWYGCQISVLHVYTVPAMLTIPPYGGPVVTEPRSPEPMQRERLQEELESFVKAAVSPEVATVAELVDGDPMQQILEKAKTLPADLIVVGTHGRSGFERLILGSVAEKVLLKATCPVLTVPPLATGVTSPPVFKQILCAVDFSDSSERGLQYALDLAQEADARLVVVHVLELQPEADLPQLPVVHLREYHERLKAEALERLTAAIPGAAREYCTIEQVVSAGKAYREILRLAQEHSVDLVVMGARGRGAVDFLTFGSTTLHVVRQATCPVLTLRAT